jgi:3-hydroxyacyl-[acyl-carrier-protein] dehydratase
VRAAAGQDWIEAPATVPYAAPMRAVDAWRCHHHDGGRTVTARLRVDPDEANLRGHFPGFPILPGVFLVEALGQAMTLSAGDGVSPRLRAIDSVRFVAPLLGGDVLTLEIEVTADPDGGWRATAEARRGDGDRAARIRARFDSGRARFDSGTARPATAATAPADGGPITGEGSGAAHIRHVLPQRHPMLLVDRVLAREPGRSLRAVKAVSGSDPCYAGLPEGAPPERYAYPRSLLIESFGQSAALLWLDDGEPAAGEGQVLLFAGARQYHFEDDAFPGDVLRHEVRLDSVVAGTAFASGETWVGGRRVAAVAALIAARRPRDRPLCSSPRQGFGEV